MSVVSRSSKNSNIEVLALPRRTSTEVLVTKRPFCALRHSDSFTHFQRPGGSHR